MNVAQYLLLNILGGKDTKKYLAITLSSMFIIVALPFAAVFAMGESALSFLAGTASAKDAETKGFFMGKIEGAAYAWGNCTYWAFAQRMWDGHPIPTTWGNANTWDDGARRDGYLVDHIPSVGAVYQTDGGDLGHVAYVKAVDLKTGDWTITEMNAQGLNVVSERTFSKDSAQYYNFIHYKEGEKPWNGLPISTPQLNTGNLSL